MRVLAGVLAAIAVACWVAVAVHRCGGAEPSSETGPGGGSASDSGMVARPPAPGTLVNATVAAMFGAICRHEVACGIGVGFEARCAYIEETMKKMPRALGVGDCTAFDETEAKGCLAEIARRSCDDFARALDLPSLQAALGRIPSCRRACPSSSRSGSAP